jgi:hypothetical protein
MEEGFIGFLWKNRVFKEFCGNLVGLLGVI